MSEAIISQLIATSQHHNNQIEILNGSMKLIEEKMDNLAKLIKLMQAYTERKEADSEKLQCDYKNSINIIKRIVVIIT